MELLVNGKRAVIAPIRAVPSTSVIANRPPENIVVNLLPKSTHPGELAQCVVESHPYFDDRDFDVVRYRYEWALNGSPVRDIVSAAQSDTLSTEYTALGGLLTCRVTASDGLAKSKIASIEGLLTDHQDSWLNVCAASNLFAAGHGTRPAPEGSGVGLFPLTIDLVPGASDVSFPIVLGSIVTADGQAHGADGVSGPTDIQSVDGIAGLTASRQGFLAAVFLNDAEPASPAPPRLAFTSTVSFSSIAPEIRQTFFVGDGKTDSGDLQRFVIPGGATRLALGFASSTAGSGAPGGYDSAHGALTVCLRKFPREEVVETTMTLGDVLLTSLGQKGEGIRCSFHGLATTKLWLRISTIPMEAKLSVTLKGPDGKILSKGIISTTKSSGVVKTYPLPVDGEYTILLSAKKDGISNLRAETSVTVGNSGKPKKFTIGKKKETQLKLVDIFGLPGARVDVVLIPTGNASITPKVVVEGVGGVLDIAAYGEVGANGVTSFKDVPLESGGTYKVMVGPTVVGEKWKVEISPHQPDVVGSVLEVPDK